MRRKWRIGEGCEKVIELISVVGGVDGCEAPGWCECDICMFAESACLFAACMLAVVASLLSVSVSVAVSVSVVTKAMR